MHQSPILSPFKILVGGILVISPFLEDWVVGLGALISGLVALYWLERHPNLPRTLVLLGAAPGAVCCQLLRNLQQISALPFEALQDTVSSGMMFGLLAGMGIPLLASGTRTWGRGSAFTAAAVTTVLVMLAGAAPMCGCSTREKAYVAAMKSDLRNLTSAQETYFAAHHEYASDIASLVYGTSTGISVQILAATKSGWYAVAAHGMITHTCSISVGEGVPNTDMAPGSPSCTN